MAEEKEKICPLTYAVGKGAYDQEVSNFDYCVKEQCAWWNKEGDACAVLTISNFIAVSWYRFDKFVDEIEKEKKRRGK